VSGFEVEQRSFGCANHSHQELSKLKYDLFLAQRENRKLLQQAEAARDEEAAKFRDLDLYMEHIPRLRTNPRGATVVVKSWSGIIVNV
jgi:hypothetical protein